jgi:hypothetical protein
MAGVDARDLHGLAVELLDAAMFALDTLPAMDATLKGAPERRYVSPGTPALDCCDQLTVHIASLEEAPTEPLGLGAGRRASLGRVNHAVLTLTLTRCVPTGTHGKTTYTPPTDLELNAAAEQIDADGWALWNHLYNRIRAGLLFSLCDGVFWLGARSLGPEGGCAGWVFGFRVVLDGYEETL